MLHTLGLRWSCCGNLRLHKLEKDKTFCNLQAISKMVEKDITLQACELDNKSIYKIEVDDREDTAHSTSNGRGYKVKILKARKWNPQGLVAGEKRSFWDPNINPPPHNPTTYLVTTSPFGEAKSSFHL
ncbi:hypothetical protein VNO80_18508 [Phaseolus coccineus]|uniref:Uncharacterized protein n=1 Tax=Phaseolus coccineus TaxID=3886 RepID=A0AAN9QYZ9_PHACN